MGKTSPDRPRGAGAGSLTAEGVETDPGSESGRSASARSGPGRAAGASAPPESDRPAEPESAPPRGATGEEGARPVAAGGVRTTGDQPADATPSGGASTPAVGPVDAAAVRRIWPEVLDAAKRRRRTTHALLMNVSVHSVEHGVLTLVISSEPLSRILAQDVNTDVVRGAIRDVLGVDWRVQVRVDGGPPVGGADPGGPPAPPPEDDPRDDEPGPPPAGAGPATRTDPEEAAISLLQSTLGAKRMDG